MKPWILGVLFLSGAALFNCAKATDESPAGAEEEDGGSSKRSKASSGGTESSENPDLTPDETEETGEPEDDAGTVDTGDDAGDDGGPPTGDGGPSKDFVQRYLCATTPQDANVFCSNKGYAIGTITKTSACFRIDDFNVKDVTYTCSP